MSLEAELRKKFPKLFEDEDLPSEKELVEMQEEAYKQKLKMKMDEMKMLESVYGDASTMEDTIPGQNGNQIPNPAKEMFSRVLGEYQAITNEYSQFIDTRKFDKGQESKSLETAAIEGIVGAGKDGKEGFISHADIEEMLGNPAKTQEFLDQFADEELNADNPDSIPNVLSQMLGKEFVDEYLGSGIDAVRASRQAVENPSQPSQAVVPNAVLAKPETTVYEKTLDTIKNLMSSSVPTSGLVGGAKEIVDKVSNQARTNRASEKSGGIA